MGRTLRLRAIACPWPRLVLNVVTLSQRSCTQALALIVLAQAVALFVVQVSASQLSVIVVEPATSVVLVHDPTPGLLRVVSPAPIVVAHNGGLSQE